MQRDVSYGELVALQDLFYEQVEEQGIVFRTRKSSRNVSLTFSNNI